MINFQSYHGCGNDFIYITTQDAQRLISEKRLTRFIQKICHRRFGIGADGLIYATKEGENYKMNYYNSDGSQANMCGNGMRTFRQYLADNFNETAAEMIIQTSQSQVTVRQRASGLIDVNLGAIPEIIAHKIEGVDYFYTYTMTDHVVCFGNSIPQNYQQIGAKIERHPNFPQGTNVNFVQIDSLGRLTLETWERGSGHTLACGTGASASALVYRNNFAEDIDKVTIAVEGGVLEVEFMAGEIHLIGPSLKISEGFFLLED
ncbi:MAG: diaminopimelate epimerase [Culicoidibacterales bacterium]